MDVKTAARVLQGGRVALGAALVAVPGTVGRHWVGASLADRPGVRALLRAVGTRDLVLGMIAIHTLDHPDVAPRWQATLAAVDVTDAVGTGLAASDLPRGGVAGTIAIAGASAAAEVWFARVLARGA